MHDSPDPASTAGLPAPLAALVRALDARVGGGLTTAGVVAALAAAPVPAAAVLPLTRWRAGGYTRNRVWRGRHFELLAMRWAPGCLSTIHDHAGQRCWLALLAGALRVEGFDLAEPADRGRLGPHHGLRRRPDVLALAPGDVDYRGPDNDIHRIANLGAEDALSLHVYVLPFDRCLAYDPDLPRAMDRPLPYDNC